jgi:hypothetical protein
VCDLMCSGRESSSCVTLISHCNLQFLGNIIICKTNVHPEA